MLRIVAINGSERAQGNTSAALEHARSVAEDHGTVLDIINLRELTITPCAPCGDCNDRSTPCALRDDTAEVVRRMCAADGIIYAAPVHGYGMSSLMQTFIERAGVGFLRFDRPLTNKVAGAIVTGRRYSHTSVHAQLVHNILLNRMILAGSGYPATIHAGARGETWLDREGLDSVSRMVVRMITVMSLLRSHHALTGRSLPVPPATERVLS